MANGITDTGAIASERGVVALTRSEIVRWRNAVFLIFALSGIGLASWIARTPAIRDSLGASTFEMGLIVFGVAAGAIVGLTLSSHVIAKIGSKATIAGSVTGAGVGIVIVGVGATMTVTPLVVVGLALFGLGNGMCDVAMNVEGAANERALGRTVMPLFHASFSMGTIVGAGIGAAAEQFGVPIVVHLAVIGAVMIGAVLVSVRFLQPDPFATKEESGADDTAEESKGWKSRLSIWKDRRTLLIGVIVLGMAFAEGSANDWLALAMVDGHGVDNATGALVFGIFVTAMTVGRVGGVFLLDTFGRVPVLRVSAVLAGLGLLVVIFAPVAWLAGVGVVLWGLGSALGFPVGMSAAADDPRNAASRVSAVATIGYLAFLVGPPLIGFIGEHVGLLNALLLVLTLVAVAGIVSPAARKPRLDGVGSEPQTTRA
ncbi:MAG TPA: MFS transporter [Nakamurella sp.]|nr:MFS transporter [Nakamurella sp.]